MTTAEIMVWVNLRMRRDENWKVSAWHYLEADLEAACLDLFGTSVAQVNGIDYVGRELNVGDLIISGGCQMRCWAD